MKWQHWKTRTKLFVGFGTIVFFSLIIAYIGYRNSSITYFNSQNITLLQKSRENFILARLNVRTYVDSKDTSYYYKALDAIKKCKSEFDLLNQHSSTSDIAMYSKEFDQLLNQYDSSLHAMNIVVDKINLIAKQRIDTRNVFIKEAEAANISRDNDINYYFNQGRLSAVYLLAVIKEKYYTDAMTSLDKSMAAIVKIKKPDLESALVNYRQTITDYYQSAIKLRELEINQGAIGSKLTEVVAKMNDDITMYMADVHHKSARNLIVISFFVVLFSISITYIITSYFNRMLMRDAKLAETYASGNLSFSVPEEDLELKDEFGDLTRSMVAMGEKINLVVTDIYNGAKSVALAGQQIKDSAQQISHGANQQASSVEEVSSSMEQMASNIQMNADNSILAEKIVLLTSESMNTLSEASKESVSSVRDITGKISIINDIAFQTNILALNAAVEAARAGEHGKGFAVVAAEVRKLAENSRIAANEIMNLSNNSLQTTEMAGAEMGKIKPEIEKTVRLVQEITSSSKEQNVGAEQVNIAIQKLNQVTQHNAASAEELATSAEELASQAGQLNETVSYFKISV